MSTTNVAVRTNTALVEEVYQAFKQGNIPFILDQLANDCEWNISGSPLLTYAGTYKGKDTGRFFKSMDEVIEFTAFDVQDVKELNKDEVIAFGLLSVRSRTTGKEGKSKWVMHWKFREGKVTYFQDYVDTVQIALTLQ